MRKFINTEMLPGLIGIAVILGILCSVVGILVGSLFVIDWVLLQFELADERGARAMAVWLAVLSLYPIWMGVRMIGNAVLSAIGSSK